ncbi:PREDICTED: sideroflexin-2-like [Acropora digitifera]|uniref:sideroflexin-2-like n=1 Tax=Acropora digitifera TaxID=70779 RepID=UPI00077A0899|nr:PREDICTED: sideroflexin-2-like [Acropora digitifera]
MADTQSVSFAILLQLSTKFLVFKLNFSTADGSFGLLLHVFVVESFSWQVVDLFDCCYLSLPIVLVLRNVCFSKGGKASRVSVDELWHAKHLVDSAFHPDTGEQMNFMGRMSFQVPGGMAITGAMLQWYRTVPAVVFWQWVNQSFNALVNYTNRNAKSTITGKQIGIAYVSATSSAVAVSVGLNTLVKVGKAPARASITVNCVFINFMNREIIDGIVVFDENDNPLGKSKKAAVKGITQVVISRVAMAAPGMILIPIMMEKIEKYHIIQRIKPIHGPLQMLLCGVSLCFMVPAACSLFPQRCSMLVDNLEPEAQETIRKQDPRIKTVYFNKGL